MLPVLLERDHGQQARPGEAAGQNVERGWSLRYRLTSSAGELLSDVLHHLPLPRHRFKRLRHILAELGEPGRAAARAGGRTRHDDPLARQMCWEWFARRLLAREAADGRRITGRGCDLLGGEIVLGGGGFEFLQFELQLFEKPHLAFTARAVNLPPHLLDRQPQMRDQGRGARCLGTRRARSASPARTSRLSVSTSSGRESSAIITTKESQDAALV